jgi:A/G-specific adenine glycosylase
MPRPSRPVPVDHAPQGPEAPAAAALLAWYDRAARRLPWRVGPAERAAGARPDPYRVWLSEIMLQQTTVAAAGPYFDRFTARWPTVEALAAAPRDELLAAWAGLGYYARARNLHACAQVVAARGGFPAEEAALRELPGVGAYTAAAIAAIAFDRPATVVDGNVERVVARLFAVETPLPDAKPELRRLAATLTPQRRPGDFAQAMMDLGATLCAPRAPACAACPWFAPCRGRATGVAAELPRKRPKPAKPRRSGAAFVAMTAQGAVLVTRRPDRGLLGGMEGPPSTDWTEAGPSAAETEAAAPFPARWRDAGAEARHVFTHFELTLRVLVARAPATAAPADMRFVPFDAARAAAPTALRKALDIGAAALRG